MQDTSLQIHETNQFKQKFKDSLTKEISTYPSIQVAKNANVYVIGDKADLVYFIESGQVKLLRFSPQGKECILAIHKLGDVFGELCIGARLETATAMADTKLKTVPYSEFLGHLRKESLLEGFAQYLAVRVIKQQQAITNLVTIDSEQRLVKILLQLAKSIGSNNSHGTIIYISQEELSEMTGTRRSYISLFMQRLRNLGLVATKEEYMIIEEQKLSHYLAQIANSGSFPTQEKQSQHVV